MNVQRFRLVDRTTLSDMTEVITFEENAVTRHWVAIIHPSGIDDKLIHPSGTIITPGRPTDSIPHDLWEFLGGVIS